jgi:HAE1 family hydrophobic/amphiphilic exporter-1
MIKRIISRPVFASVISIIIVILGILGLISLPITQYPDIAPPDVKITASYAGANAQTVMRSVVIPIEQQVNGV